VNTNNKQTSLTTDLVVDGQAGDEIIKVNGFASDDASHEEVSRIIRSSHKISLKVRTPQSSSSSSISAVLDPNITSGSSHSNTMRDPRWTVVPVVVSSGNSSSNPKHHHHAHHHHPHHRHVQSHQQTFNPLPPASSSGISPSRRKCPIHHNTVPHHQHQHHYQHAIHAAAVAAGSSKFHTASSRGSTSSPSDSDQDHELDPGSMMIPSDIVEEKIYITLKSGQSLGCSVVRGPAAYPGIFVQDVKSSSPSFHAGLEVGDQILAMNGFSFYPGHYNFDDAINKIKACSQMTLTVRKRVGLHLFHDIKRKNNVHKIRAVVHSSGNSQQQQDNNDSDYDPEKDFDLTGICGVHPNGNTSSSSQTEAKRLTGMMTGVNGTYAEDILQKVREEEERLAEDRRILAAEQQKLQHELQRLAHERYDHHHRNDQQPVLVVDQDSCSSNRSNDQIMRNMILFMILSKISLLSLFILIWCLLSFHFFVMD
jgi:hypothetical protein